MSSEQETPVDPIYQSSLRELKWILVLWLVICTWVVGYCSMFGYMSDDDSLVTILGMPSWVFWGIFVPWIVAAAVSAWFALTQMTDHSLEETSASDSASGENSDG